MRFDTWGRHWPAEPGVDMCPECGQPVLQAPCSHEKIPGRLYQRWIRGTWRESRQSILALFFL
jgi:hypothetical protein